MKKTTTQSGQTDILLGAVLALTMLLFSVSPVRAQYMSFFGDSTWTYQVTYITQPPEDYQISPPEEPNLLGVYCRTLFGCYRRDLYVHFGDGQYDSIRYDPTVCQDNLPWWSRTGDRLFEDTVYGRLYDGYYMICDMSLTEGDTFVLKGQCEFYYGNGVTWAGQGGHYQIDTQRIKMLVDSVRYISNRKTIFLSLINYQDDYFFGTGNSGILSDYNLSIRFIEGIGPTYGLLSRCHGPHFNLDGEMDGVNVYLNPWLGLLQCMYKDDSLVYMAHEALGCDQTCVDVKEYFQILINLYPNPATQYVVLDMSTGEEMNGMVTITDMMGRICLQQKAESTSCRIYVADLPVGMYFCTYTDGKRKVTKKFLKE